MNLVSVVLLAAVPAFFCTAVFGKNIFEVFNAAVPWVATRKESPHCLSVNQFLIPPWHTHPHAHIHDFLFHGETPPPPASRPDNRLFAANKKQSARWQQRRAQVTKKNLALSYTQFTVNSWLYHLGCDHLMRCYLIFMRPPGRAWRSRRNTHIETLKYIYISFWCRVEKFIIKKLIEDESVSAGPSQQPLQSLTYRHSRKLSHRHRQEILLLRPGEQRWSQNIFLGVATGRDNDSHSGGNK